MSIRIKEFGMKAHEATPEGEVAFVEGIHAETLSKDPAVAAPARLQKDVLPIFGRWLQGETQRGTPTLAIRHAAVGCGMAIVGSVAASLAGGNPALAALVMIDMQGIHKALLSEMLLKWSADAGVSIPPELMAAMKGDKEAQIKIASEHLANMMQGAKP